MFQVSDAWKATFPTAHAGILVMRDVTNPPYHAGLEEIKQQLQAELRARFAGQDRSVIAALPTIQAYNAYYKSFKKTYHVQLQLESIAWKGRSIPSVSALVEAMFMAEMKNMLLTAGHDLDILHLPLTLDASKGTESYTLLRGDEQILKAGDMMISDGMGVVSSIVYGPDQRTQITDGTRNVAFTVYAPAGIGEQIVTQHLQDIQEYALVIAPQAQVELLKVYG